MPMFFNPHNWYWVVGDHPQVDPKSQGTKITVAATNEEFTIPEPPQVDEIIADTEVYSSKHNQYVPSNDPTYLAWIETVRADHGVYRPTSRIDTEANLKEVLQLYARPPVNTAVPLISLDPDGVTLSCTMGIWTGEPDTYSYEWQMDSMTVGTDSATYEITADDMGKVALCRVTATNDNGSTQAPASNRIVLPEPKDGLAKKN